MKNKDKLTIQDIKKAIKILEKYKGKGVLFQDEKPYYVQVENPRVIHVKMFVVH